MHCCSTPPSARDRCAFTSVLLLGAMLAMQTSPCGRPSLAPLFFLLGLIPLVTFRVAAPGRIALRTELTLMGRDLESFVLGRLLALLGRRSEASAVRMRQRQRVEEAYRGADEPFAHLVAEDPLRLHHARRLASLVTLALVGAGLSLPLLQPEVYTFGDGLEAPMVALLDLLTLGVVGRMVAERAALRLLEVTAGARLRSLAATRAIFTPLSAMLGMVLGAVGGLVVVGAASLACALESAWLSGGVSLSYAAAWFLAQTAVDGLVLGMGLGAIVGAGMGLAHAPRPASDAA